MAKGALATNVKLAEKNESVTYFIKKCLALRENEQIMVLNDFSEAPGNRYWCLP